MNTPCTLWIGAKTANGYGVRNLGHRNALVHRIAYCQAHGIELDEIKGLIVRHSCDVRNCHNPDHLSLGTAQQNSNDMVRRGRTCHGDRHHATKFTAEQLAELKALHATGLYTQKFLARRFGVSPSVISRRLSGVIRRKGAVSHSG